MPQKKNPDYSGTAVNLTNPPQVKRLLLELHNTENRITTIQEQMDALIPQQVKDTLAALITLRIETNKVIRTVIDEFGSYQNTETGEYAVKQRRESIIYKPELVRQYAPSKIASFVLIESVDSQALDALIKAGQLTPEIAKQCGEVKETFAYIVR